MLPSVWNSQCSTHLSPLNDEGLHPLSPTYMASGFSLSCTHTHTHTHTHTQPHTHAHTHHEPHTHTHTHTHTPLSLSLMHTHTLTTKVLPTEPSSGLPCPS